MFEGPDLTTCTWPDQFRAFVLKEFAYLEATYSCSVSIPPTPPDYPLWAKGDAVEFTNSTTRVCVRLHFIEQFPTIYLERLDAVKGQMNGCNIGMLLLLRAPELNPMKDKPSLPLKTSVEQFVCQYAMALRLVGDDILKGDFSIFSRPEKEL